MRQRSTRYLVLTLSALLGSALNTQAGEPPNGDPCLPDANGDGHPLFGLPQIRTSHEIGQFVRATTAAFGDLDGDGDNDAAVTNSSWVQSGVPVEWNLAIFMNHGDGTFADPVIYDVGTEPTSVELADLDDDSDLDVALINVVDDNVSVLRNNGDGTLAPHVTYPVGDESYSLVVGDVDGDGDRDLATLSTTQHNVRVLKNNGNGTFVAAGTFFVGNVMGSIFGANTTFPSLGPFMALGDLDGDRDLDLAVPCFMDCCLPHIRILFNTGNGVFGAPVQYSGFSAGVYGLAIADLDADGDNDIAVDSGFRCYGCICPCNPVALCCFPFAPQTVAILKNNGGGAFAAPVAYDVVADPDQYAHRTLSMTIQDLDDDGDLDIGVGHRWRERVVVLPNNGDGTFGAKKLYRVFGYPWYVRAAELNGDGKVDLAVLTNEDRAKLSVLINPGDGTLIAREDTNDSPDITQVVYPWGAAKSVKSADIDSDGDLDLAVGIGETVHSPRMLILRNDGTGQFSVFGTYPFNPSSRAEHLEVGDLDGDGDPDLAVSDAPQSGSNEPGDLWVLLNQGNGVFNTSQPYHLLGLIPSGLVIGDLDGDRDHDVAVWATELHPGQTRYALVLLNQGNGALSPPVQYVLGSPPFAPWKPWGSLALGDIDDDGDLDIAGTNGGWSGDAGGQVVTLLNDGDGAFGGMTTYPSHAVRYLAMRDFDEDGDLDLAAARPGLLSTTPYLTVMPNDGKGHFTSLNAYTNIDVGPSYIASDDLNLDGHFDLVICQDAGMLSVRLGAGDGSLGPAISYGTGWLVTDITIGDFDADGDVDIVTANELDFNISLLRNRLCGPPPCPADINNDHTVNIDDLVAVITSWGACPLLPPPSPNPPGPGPGLGVGSGDMNCDNTVNGFDINPFMLAFNDINAYLKAYPFCDYFNGDMNNSDFPIDKTDLAIFCPLAGGFVSGGQCLIPGPCPADINGDRVVNIDDLVQLITSWGVCAK